MTSRSVTLVVNVMLSPGFIVRGGAGEIVMPTYGFVKLCILVRIMFVIVVVMLPTFVTFIS
jgi:hypothetical protein